jgi:hypothetical protein
VSPDRRVPPDAAVFPNGPVPLAADLVPSPAIPVRTLLTLGQAQFILAVAWPRQRLVAAGRMVPARLPRAAARARSRR